MVLLSCLEYIPSSCDSESRVAGGFKGWIMYVVREDDLAEFGVEVSSIAAPAAAAVAIGELMLDFDMKNKTEESDFCCAVFQSEAGLIT